MEAEQFNCDFNDEAQQLNLQESSDELPEKLPDQCRARAISMVLQTTKS